MPLYDVTCTSCQREWERASTIAERYSVSGCCSAPVTIYNRPANSYNPFKHYFDIGLGAEVTSLAQRRRLMKEAGFDFRDHPSVGEESARRDKRNEGRREKARRTG